MNDRIYAQGTMWAAPRLDCRSSARRSASVEVLTRPGQVSTAEAANDVTRELRRFLRSLEQSRACVAASRCTSCIPAGWMWPTPPATRASPSSRFGGQSSTASRTGWRHLIDQAVATAERRGLLSPDDLSHIRETIQDRIGPG